MKGRRFLTIMLGLALVSIGISYAYGTNEGTETKEKEYEIYPLPHTVVYDEGNFIIKQRVNVVYSSDAIDEETIMRATEIFEDKGKVVSTSNTVVSNELATNVILGVKNGKDEASMYIEENYAEVPDDNFTKLDSYWLKMNDNGIVVLGDDTDAVFYGLTTIKHILEQEESSTIRNLTITDYADVERRGFIEGYYGIPWSYEDRMSLMRFGGEFKMTSYIFAPKDDPYHTTKWREPYPEDQLEYIEEMARVGRESKVEFVWTAHPFMGGFDGNRLQEEIDALINKFEHLYDHGVRAFGVLGDDVGGLNRSQVIEIMKAVGEWAETKPDVSDPIFCPAGYNTAMAGDFSELNQYDKGFPENVQIIWTGDYVCAPINQGTLDNFRKNHLSSDYQEGETRRAPLFWLNWPVNDVNHSRMVMGRAHMLSPEINPSDLTGVVTNPMQEAEASKVSLFAIADYTWNVENFDDATSWANSFKYIEPNASEELHNLAKHMSDPAPGGIPNCPESEDLGLIVEEFKIALNEDGNYKDLAEQLIDEMDVIITSARDFHLKSTNTNLKDELLPFTNSLSDKAQAIKLYLEALLLIDEGNQIQGLMRTVEGTKYLNSSNTYKKPTLGAPLVVTPGSKVITPFATYMQSLIDMRLGNIDDNLRINISSNVNTFWENNGLANAIDGNKDTCMWLGQNVANGDYFDISFSIPQTIYGVNIILDGGTDKFKSSVLKYSTDNGKTYQEVPNGKFGEVSEVNLYDIELKNVTNIRIESTAATNYWLKLYEFSVDIDKSHAFTKKADLNGYTVAEGNSFNSIYDGNLETFAKFNVSSSKEGNKSYIGYEFNRKIIISDITLIQGD